MLGIVARLKIKPGQEEAFLSAMGALIEAVKANEPDVLSYDCFRARGSSHEFVMLEVYRSQAALDAHQAAAHVKAALPALTALLDGRPAIEVFDGV